MNAKTKETDARILIDDQLRAAGWNPADKSQVLTEVKVTNGHLVAEPGSLATVLSTSDGDTIPTGRADYVLLDQRGRPLAIIEAKKQAIQPYTAKQQALPYAWLYQLTRLQWFTEQLNARARGASYPAVTDADIFQLLVPVPTDQKVFVQFDDMFKSVSETLSSACPASGKVDDLFDLLLRRAYSGQLTAKWRESHMKELLAEMAHQAKVLNLPQVLETTT